MAEILTRSTPGASLGDTNAGGRIIRIFDAAAGRYGWAESAPETVDSSDIVDVTPAVVPADLAALEAAHAGGDQPSGITWQATVGTAGNYQTARVVGGTWAVTDTGDGPWVPTTGATYQIPRVNTRYLVAGGTVAVLPVTANDGEWITARTADGALATLSDAGGGLRALSSSGSSLTVVWTGGPGGGWGAGFPETQLGSHVDPAYGDTHTDLAALEAAYPIATMPFGVQWHSLIGDAAPYRVARSRRTGTTTFEWAEVGADSDTEWVTVTGANPALPSINTAYHVDAGSTVTFPAATAGAWIAVRTTGPTDATVTGVVDGTLGGNGAVGYWVEQAGGWVRIPDIDSHPVPDLTGAAAQQSKVLSTNAAGTIYELTDPVSVGNARGDWDIDANATFPNDPPTTNGDWWIATGANPRTIGVTTITPGDRIWALQDAPDANTEAHWFVEASAVAEYVPATATTAGVGGTVLDGPAPADRAQVFRGTGWQTPANYRPNLAGSTQAVNLDLVLNPNQFAVGELVTLDAVTGAIDLDVTTGTYEVWDRGASTVYTAGTVTTIPAGARGAAWVSAAGVPSVHVLSSERYHGEVTAFGDLLTLAGVNAGDEVHVTTAGINGSGATYKLLRLPSSNGGNWIKTAEITNASRIDSTTNTVDATTFDISVTA